MEALDQALDGPAIDCHVGSQRNVLYNLSLHLGMLENSANLGHCQSRVVLQEMFTDIYTRRSNSSLERENVREVLQAFQTSRLSSQVETPAPRLNQANLTDPFQETMDVMDSEMEEFNKFCETAPTRWR